MARGRAMSRSQAEQAIDAGIGVAGALVADGVAVVEQALARRTLDAAAALASMATLDEIVTPGSRRVAKLRSRRAQTLGG